jgi:hypothetical protein
VKVGAAHGGKFTVMAAPSIPELISGGSLQESQSMVPGPPGSGRVIGTGGAAGMPGMAGIAGVADSQNKSALSGRSGMVTARVTGFR